MTYNLEEQEKNYSDSQRRLSDLAGSLGVNDERELEDRIFAEAYWALTEKDLEDRNDMELACLWIEQMVRPFALQDHPHVLQIGATRGVLLLSLLFLLQNARWCDEKLANDTADH